MPESLQTEIFRDFRVRDLLRVSEVCTSFNKTISTTQEFMNKIMVVGTNESHQSPEHLKNSTRQYLHLALRHPQDTAAVRLLVVSRKWRSMNLLGCDHDESEEHHHGLFISILRWNQQLEALTINYDVMKAIFERDITERGIRLKLSKFHLQKGHAKWHETFPSDNFIKFFETQKDSLKEFAFMHSAVSDRGIEFSLSNDPKYKDDICIRALQMVFKDFKLMRKLVIADKTSMIMKSFIANPNIISLTPNYSITELRIRFDRTKKSDLLFKVLVAACPNLKELYVREINQPLLQYCSDHLKHLEMIYAFSFTANDLPCATINFAKLKRLQHWVCKIDNHPELDDWKSTERNDCIVQMLKY